MPNPRKIVLILGNGFDLDLGLKTSYKDFWESEYCPKNYPAPLIYHLNQRWKENISAVRWYDLENELLEYYKTIPDPKVGKDYITIKEHECLKRFKPSDWSFGYPEEDIPIITSLINKGVIVPYVNIIPGVEVPFREDISLSPIERDRRAFQRIKEKFCEYLKTLRSVPQNENSFAEVVSRAMGQSIKQGDDVQIFSFNYTPIRYLSQHLLTDHLQYMHGDVSTGTITIGTRDNMTMAKEYDFLQKVIDSPFRRPNIVSALKEAQEVIIFGHSLGENDRQYFEPFFIQHSQPEAARPVSIYFFTKDGASEIELKRSLLIMTNNNLSSLLSLNTVSSIRTAEPMRAQQDFISFLGDHYMSTYLDY